MNSSTKTFKIAIQETNRLFVPLCRESWLELLGLLIFSEVLSEYFKFTATFAPQLESGRLVSQLGQGLSDLTVGLLLMLIVPVRLMQLRGLTKKSPWAYGAEFVWPLTVESLRFAASVLLKLLAFLVPGLIPVVAIIIFWPLSTESFVFRAAAGFWLLALIIPCVIKYLRYSFFPLIVMFDPEAPRVDVLKKSEQLAKGVTRWLFLVALTTLLIQLKLSSIQFANSFSTAPVKLSLMALIGMGLEVYIYGLTFELYRTQVQSLKRG